MDNITKDPAYNAVDPRDFPAMLDVQRYGQRSNAFDKIISATHEHFWDPLDRKYIDFAQSFDVENEYLVNPSANTDLKTAIGEKLDEKRKIKLVNLDEGDLVTAVARVVPDDEASQEGDESGGPAPDTEPVEALTDE